MIYKTEGVCASEISFEIEKGLLHNVSFMQGCPGNLQAIQILVEGMPALLAISKLRGIRCGGKETSCVDQLAKAIECAMGEQEL